MTEYRVQMTELFALLIKLKQSDDRVQVTGERWKVETEGRTLP